MNLIIFMLRESHIQKPTYRMISFIWNLWKGTGIGTADQWWARGWRWEKRMTMEYEGTFRGNKNDWYDYRVGYTTIYTFVKIHQIVHLILVDFIVCKLYLSKADFLKVQIKLLFDYHCKTRFPYFLGRFPPLSTHVKLITTNHCRFYFKVLVLHLHTHTYTHK